MGIDVNEGSDKTVATDLVAGEEFPKVKLNIGADGEAMAVDDGQQVMASSIPVVVASDQSVIPIRPQSAHYHAYLDQLSNFGDIEVSTTSWSAGYGAPTNTFFDCSDAGFDTNSRYIRLPMSQYNRCAMTLRNQSDVSMTVNVHLALATIGGAGSLVQIASFSVSASGGNGTAAPFSGGSGAATSYHNVPALATPSYYAIMEIVPDSDPTTGHIRFFSARN